MRRNTVKQSLSRLKDRCDWPSPLAHNHIMHADAGMTAGKPTRSLVQLPPELLLRDAVRGRVSVRVRLRLRVSVRLRG